jgi:NRPS condensation-like uncharacterized protein
MHRQPASSLDLFTDSTRLMGDATMLSVMEFDRHLDAERLRLAASRCLDAFPILSSRLSRGHGPAYWEYQEGDGPADVTVVDVGKDYRPSAVRALDPHTGPQAMFRILRSEKRDVVVINMAHAAADGSGMKALMGTLMTAYLDPRSVKACEDILPVRDTLWTADLLDGQDVPRRDRIDIIDPMWPRPCGTSDAPSTYHRAVVGSQGLASMKGRAKARGGTVNDLLMAAYFMAMSDLTGHMGPQHVFFPVNLRRYLKDGSRVMSNQAVNVSFTLERKGGERMSQILDKVIGETSRMKGGRIGIREQVAFDRGCDPEGRAVEEMVQGMARQQEQGLADIFVSNPGPVPLPPVGGLVSAYLAYPGLLMPSTCFVISTFREEMTVTMGYQDDEGSREATLKAVQNFLGYLPVRPSQARTSWSDQLF